MLGRTVSFSKGPPRWFQQAPWACRSKSTSGLTSSTYTAPSNHYNIPLLSRTTHIHSISQARIQQTTSLHTYAVKLTSEKRNIAEMNSQVWQPTRRVVVQTARSAPSISRGASSATSSQPFYQYASQGLRKLARQRQEVRAPADWMGLLRKAGKGLPM